MFCLFGPSKCANILQTCEEEKILDCLEGEKMLCSEGASGQGLLLQLGRLIVRARTDSPAPPKHKHPQHPHAQQTHTQQPANEEDARLEATLSAHIDALWTQQAPFCVEVVLAPSCPDCHASMYRDDSSVRGVLLERWTMRALLDKSESPSVISSPWLLNAVRSQLHFSQLSAWRARRAPRHERRRKLSREQCNIKKLEANVDEEPERKLTVVYSVKSPPERPREFAKPPADHTFPLTDTGNNTYLKVVLESLPRLDEIPEVRCGCKRRSSKDRVADDLGARLNDLNIGSRKYEGAINSNIGTPGRRNSIISNPNPTSDYLLSVKDTLVDDRMHTPCSENGKHKCNCDDESDTNKTQAKKLDERRIKEIAKYKRRIRKEKMRKFCDSTSSEGEKKETTSIPILQASRFDRFRAIGCYRNQTYLTLPASRIETKSPFIDNDYTPPEFKKTNTIATQTDFACPCGNPLEISHKCESCKGMVRSEGTYNLATLGARRKLDDGDKSLKKHKCDNNISNFNDGIIKRPKLRRLYPIVDRLERIVTDRNRNTEKDMRELHLKTDDSVFSTPKEGNSPRKETNLGSHDSVVNSNDESDLHPTAESGKMHPKYNEGLHPNTDELGKFHPKYNKELHDNTDESGKLHPKYNKELHDKTDEAGKLQPKYNKELHHNTDESGKLHPKYNTELHHNTDESGKLHPKYNTELHHNTDESGKLHPKYKDGLHHKSKHEESNGHSSEKDKNETTPPEVSRNPYSEETPKVTKRQKTFSINDDEFITYEKCDYGTIDKHDSEIESPVEEQPDFKFSNPERNEIEGEENLESLKDEFPFPSRGEWAIPSRDEAARFRARVHSAARLVFRGGDLPPACSPRPSHLCIGFDDTIHGVDGVKSALFQQIPASPLPAPRPPSPRREAPPRARHRPSTGLLGSFEESALQGRLEAVATVHGFTAELGASGAFCPPHRRLPVTVFFYAPGGTAAPYMGHINLGPSGYGVPRAGSVQVSLFNPHGTLVKMFCVLYDLSSMPRAATTFLRQRTLRVSATAGPAPLRYLIHLRFMTTKTGKLYLHTDIRLIVSRKADLDTATALRAPLSPPIAPPRGAKDKEEKQPPNRVFGGSSEHDAELPEIGYDNTSYELKSYTYAPDNPKYSPR